MAVVRYIVSDVSAAIPFYTEQLGFELKINPAPGFAMLARDDLRLMLNAPGAGGAGTSADDGSVPAPGGWSRFQLEVAAISQSPSLVMPMRPTSKRIPNVVTKTMNGRNW